MCYAIPGRVEKVEGDVVIVNYSGDKRAAKTLLNVKPGDYVYVNGGIVVEKLNEKDARDALGIMNVDVPELYFFKYAFPCAHLKLERGDIGQEEYNELKNQFLSNNPPNKEILEKIFAPGFVFIKKLASQMNKDHWDIEVLKEYWENYHNKIIENEEGDYKNFSESLKDLCRIHLAEVIDKKGDNLVVRYKDKVRVVFNSLTPHAKPGDRVKIHYSYAIESL